MVWWPRAIPWSSTWLVATARARRASWSTLSWSAAMTTTERPWLGGSSQARSAASRACSRPPEATRSRPVYSSITVGSPQRSRRVAAASQGSAKRRIPVSSAALASAARSRNSQPGAGIRRSDLRLHDLRHSGLTWTAARGATTAELMHRAGHASVAVAIRYQPATADRDRPIAEARPPSERPRSLSYGYEARALRAPSAPAGPSGPPRRASSWPQKQALACGFS